MKGYGQNDTLSRSVPSDTAGVVVSAFSQYRIEQQVLPAQHLLMGSTLDRFHKTSFLPGLNALPGIRMEERSPGSYRLSMRGSSLRSPFGVRNVKVYYNGLPLTDAGGNTYFNQLALHNLTSIEISKGPAGSMYGAGTGGVVLLNSLRPWQSGMELESLAGSYGLFGLMGVGRFLTNEKLHAVSAGYTTQQGYRDHTAMHRANISYSGELVKSKRYILTGHLLAADMYYQTPGGLTQAEFNANPRQARPVVGVLPSAAAAKAAIFQQNLLTGMHFSQTMHKGWQNQTALYGSFARVRNPSIRNYEQRSEPGTGLRTEFIKKHKTDTYKQQWVSGIEAQWGFFDIHVYTNRSGEKGNPISADKLRFFTGNIFTQFSRQYGERWDFSGGISYFRSRVKVKRLFPLGNDNLKKDFLNDWAPRFSALFRPADGVQLSAVVSRGFSPPTVSELLPSTGVLNANLQPEYGWNFEAGIRLQSPNRKWNTSLNFFRFNLKQAIVQRRDNTGADFFDNAGGTRQQGIEWTGNFLHNRPLAFLQVISIKGSYTYSHFRYVDFKQVNSDFSGNVLPSVPAHTVSLLADLRWKPGFFVHTTFYAASAIWLNDANTARADAYQLLTFKAGYGKKVRFFIGVDNLLDETYSLGNDINAFGGRFFNVAAGRNFFVGVGLQISKPNSGKATKQ